MLFTYFSICITEYSLSRACYSLLVTWHSLCKHVPGAWVTRFTALSGSLLDRLVIICGSIYRIGALDMWINHSGKTTYTTVLWGGFRAYLLTVTTETLRFLAGSRASPGHRSAASTIFFWCQSLLVIFGWIYRTSWAYSDIRSKLHMFVSMVGSR